MFTLYRIVKRSAAKWVSDRTSVHTGNASSRTIFAPEKDCPAPVQTDDVSVCYTFDPRMIFVPVLGLILWAK